MIKQIIKSITPPLVADLARGMRRNSAATSQTSGVLSPDRLDLEYIDFYGNTSLFALEVLQRFGPLRGMRLFSLGNKMAHLADYLGLFGTVYHNSMLTTAVPVEGNHGLAELKILREDFFDLPALELDCVISHAAIHCLNDTRYGNAGSQQGWSRPYQAAAKLRAIIGQKSVPIIVSIAAHQTESFINDNARLSHDKFVASFTNAGFTLREHFFDYLCYGMPFRPEYFEPKYRRLSVLPTLDEAPSEYNYVIGNYYFS
ncbi:MAG TPA: hypothetical protein VE863_11060 [Pyrinomonadaceae bacterium]|nr:hypothetical protein [Pyrinomonadaceae bacterium]